MAEVFYTPRYDDDLVAIYKHSKREWGERVALETLKQIEAIEHRALQNPAIGKLDPEFHSEFFRCAFTENSQTVFFHRLGSDVVMLTAGYGGRDWKSIMDSLSPELLDFLARISNAS